MTKQVNLKKAALDTVRCEEEEDGGTAAATAWQCGLGGRGWTGA
jgi:hypothetical protein